MFYRMQQPFAGSTKHAKQQKVELKRVTKEELVGRLAEIRKKKKLLVKEKKENREWFKSLPSLQRVKEKTIRQQ